jgi:hypothetical protein
MMNLNEYVPGARTKVLVYGAPKTGKTALVGKLASKFNLHWFDLESGIKTLLNPAILNPSHRANVKVFSIPDHKLNPVAIDTIREVLRGGTKKICHAHGKVNCPICAKNAPQDVSEIDLLKFDSNDILVIDSLSQLANSAMNRAILKEIQKPGGEEYKRTFTDYATQGALMEQCLSFIQALDVNICCISHEVDGEKSDSKEKLVPIAGTRNFSLTVAKYFDSVVYASILNKSHRANCETTYSPSVITGSRLPVNLDGKKGDELSIEELFTTKCGA